MTHKPKIWVDLDGVLADYNSGYKALGGDPDEKGAAKAMRFKKAPNFYRHLKLLPDAMKLWDFVKHHDPHILSASSNYLPKTSFQDKHDWVAEHLHLHGDKVVIVKMPNLKQKHANKGDILIDDNAKNCSEWQNAGGTAILHVSAERTIRELKHLLGLHEAQNVVEAFENLPVIEPLAGHTEQALNSME